jgi:hypothetical protein
MLSYEDLTASQKKWVDLVEIHYPELITRDTLTYADLKRIHTEFVGKRAENKKYKCSMPLWLITNNAISRGLYRFPASWLVFDEYVGVVDEPLEIIYREELKRFGIEGKR